MDENFESRLIEGLVSESESAEAMLLVRTDAELRSRLERQAQIHAALGVLLAPESAERRCVSEALRRLRESSLCPPAASRTSGTIVRMISGLHAQRAAAALAMLAAGAALGRWWAVSRVATPDRQPSTTMKRDGSSGSAPASRPLEGTSGWLARLASADSGAMPGLFGELQSQPAGPERAQALEWAVWRWAELDPAAAAGYVAENFRGDRYLLGTLFAAWARVDGGAAWEAATSLPDAGNSQTARRAVMTWLSKSDPLRFAQLASSGQTATTAQWVSAARTLASRGPMGSEELKVFADLDKPTRAAALTAVVDFMAGTDPFGAVTWSRSLADADDQKAALSRAIIALGGKDPQRAGRELSGLPNARAIAGEIVRAMAPADPHRALVWARQFGGDNTPGLTRDLLLALVRNADSRSLEVLAELSKQGGAAVFRKDERLDDIFWQARGIDFGKALSWVMNEAPRDAFGWDNMRRGLLFSWSKENRQAAAEWIDATVKDPVEREYHRSSIVWEILSTSGDTQRAWDYNMTRDAGPERGLLAVEIVKRQAAVDPAAAAEWLKLLPAEANRAQAVQSVGSVWGATAPDEAVEWAAALSMPDDRVAAYRAIADQWAKFDSLKASEWLSALPTSPERDSAAAALVEQIAPFEGDSAFAWAMSIAHAKTRQQALEAAVRAWAQQDAEAARSALRNPAAGIPSADRQRLEVILANPAAPAPPAHSPKPPSK